MVGALSLLLNEALAQVPQAQPAVPAPDTGLAPWGEIPATFSLQQAISLFRQRGYDLLIADASVVTARGALQSAAQFANPSVTFTYGRSFGPLAEPENANAYAASINDAGTLLDQIIGKRRLRIAVAEAALDSARFNRRDAERTLVATLKQAYVAVITASKQLDVNKDLYNSNKQTEDLIATRYRLGAISEADLANQKTATFESAQQVEIATQAYLQARTTLAFLLGARGKTPDFKVEMSLVDGEPPIEIRNATPESLHALAVEHRPDLLAQRLQVQRAAAAIDSIRRQVVPDLAFGVGYAQQGIGTASVTPPTLSFDITFTPPILYHLQGEMTQAEADLQAQRAALAKLDAQVLSDVDTGFAAFDAARRRLDRLDHGFLEQAKLARDLTRIQYEKGAASLVDLLVAQRAYVATLSEHVQALNDFWMAVYQLEAAAGVEFKS
jgi:cobalt-zinc-cadmium efflux system outer membrane protein